MDLDALIHQYVELLRPHFGSLLRVDDSEREKEWVAIMLDGAEEEFFFSLYGTDCVHLYWCDECFILDCRRESLVSSDTYGDIVLEGQLEPQQIPPMVVELVLRLKDSRFLRKQEVVLGWTPSGYDTIRAYTILAETTHPPREPYCLNNITIQFCKTPLETGRNV